MISQPSRKIPWPHCSKRDLFEPDLFRLNPGEIDWIMQIHMSVLSKIWIWTKQTLYHDSQAVLVKWNFWSLSMHLCPPIERLGWRRDFHLMHLWKQMKPHMDETKDNCKQRKAGKPRKHGFILHISLGIETFCHQKNFLGSNFELSTRFAILQNATRHSSRCYNLRINTSNQTKMIGFFAVRKRKTLDLSSHLVWSGVTFNERIRAIHSLEATSVDMSSISFQSISLLNFQMLTSQKKWKESQKIQMFGICWDKFPYFSHLHPKKHGLSEVPGIACLVSAARSHADNKAL